MKAYKLTDSNNQTRNQTQWGPNITHTAVGEGKEPCSDGWIHFYPHPLLAVLMNPIHASFKSPRLWECETSGEHIHEALKSGCKTLTTIKEIPLPEITVSQRIAFGILCAKEVYHNEKWNEWADRWLSGEDRTPKSADAVAYTTYAASARAASAASARTTYAASAYAAYAATYAAADAAAAAAYAAAYANATANAANAANAADAAADAADAAYYAAASDSSVNFTELAEKAMTYK